MTLLTPQEVAEILRTTKRTLSRMRLAGDGPRYVRIRKRVLYRREDLDRYIEQLVSTEQNEGGEA